MGADMTRGLFYFCIGGPLPPKWCHNMWERTAEQSAAGKEPGPDGCSTGTAIVQFCNFYNDRYFNGIDALRT
jgi:hypothetical protein